jgi:hypothetical protein
LVRERERPTGTTVAAAAWAGIQVSRRDPVWPQRIGSTVGASEGGGLARRATTTSTAIVVLVVVATAIAVVVVFIVVFSGCHYWAGGMAWRLVAWLSGAQHWCRAPSGQPKDSYYPCGSPPVADRPEL